MSSFTEPLCVLIDNHPKEPFILAKEFYYGIDSEHGHEYVVIPKGYRTDFASIPGLFRIFYERVGQHSKAALVHDYIYDTRGVSLTTAPGVKRPVSRSEADRIFLQAMEVLGVRYTKRRAFWFGVRVGGWWAWMKRSIWWEYYRDKAKGIIIDAKYISKNITETLRS